MEYVTLKSYDGKMVRVPEEKVEEYINNQKKIARLLEEGKSLEEVKEIMKSQ